MPKVHLVAVKPLRYATRALRAGDAFSAIPKDARLLKLIGKAVDAPAGVAPDLKPAEAPDPVKALRARYAELTGQEANKRWGARRLETEIDELTNPPPPVVGVAPVLEAPGDDASGQDDMPDATAEELAESKAMDIAEREWTGPEVVADNTPEAGGDDNDKNGSLI